MKFRHGFSYKNDKGDIIYSIGCDTEFGTDCICEVPVWIGNSCILKLKNIGAFTIVNDGTDIDFVKSIGRFCFIGKNCKIGMSDCLTSETFFAKFGDNYSYLNTHLMNENSNDRDETDITIGNDVWIGDSAVVLKGVTIGDGAVIKSGAYVTEDVEAHAVVAGCPAKKISVRGIASGIEGENITEADNGVYFQPESMQINTSNNRLIVGNKVMLDSSSRINRGG